MIRVSLATALNLLMPRHNGYKKSWQHQGWCATFNSRMLSRVQDKAIRKLVPEFDKACQRPTVEWVKVVDNEVYFCQRTLRYSTICWMARRAGFKWQNWQPGRLPIYLKYKGKLVVWNGTHRTVLAMLTNKRLRAKVLDLDAFIKWKKSHPNRRDWGVKRIVVFGKGKRRGDRK